MQNLRSLTATGGLVQHDPLLFCDDGFHVRLETGLVPLMMQGEIVPRFLPGWKASHLYTAFAPLFLLELVHEDGRRATWFLDYRMQHVADAVERLGAEAMDLLRLKAVPVLAGLLHTTLHQCRPALSDQSRAFLSINEPIRREIALNCLDFLLRPPDVFLAEHLMPASLVFRGETDDRLRAISKVHLAAGLVADFQDRLAAAFRDGVLAWPSPVDGAILHAQGCFCFDDFHFAYRFADERHGLVFFVLVADHYSRIGGVWFPAFGLLVSHDEITRGVARYMLRHIPYWFVNHSCVWAELLVPYLCRGAKRFASVMRGRPGVHIGHQLWNELSGIELLLRDGAEALPEWIVLDPDDGIELYGALESLFPRLRGHVNRTLRDIPALIHYAYTQDVSVLRVTRDHVGAGLRHRILQRIHAEPFAAAVRRTIGPSRKPVILLGLRVENRTLVDVAGFFADLVRFIARHFPGAVLVVDGHNSRGAPGHGKVIESHGEPGATRKPVEIEHELVALLRQRFSGTVVIADTIGQPIAASLAWADRCDCFVSIWGASLAKYRWVCNKPGLVVTSRHNLRHRGDLHIYDAPAYMEAPTRLRFVAADLVTDRPDVLLLVNVAPGNPSFYNFDLEQEPVFAEIRDLIEASTNLDHAAPVVASGSLQ